MIRVSFVSVVALALVACGGPSAPPVTPVDLPVTPPCAAIAPPAPVSEAPPPRAETVAPPLAPGSIAGATQAFPAGIWPEGLALGAGSLWVAESGSRRILRLDPKTGAVTARIPVGRLPVELFAGPDAALYTVAHTDRALYRIDPATNRARVVHRFAQYPEGATFAEGAFYALILPGGSSIASMLVRFETPGGPVTTSAKFGPNATSFVVAQGKIFVPQSEGHVFVFDAKTLEQVATIDVGGRPYIAAASGDAVYVGDRGRIARIDLATLAVTQTAAVSTRPTGLLAEASGLVATLEDGSVVVLDPVTLTRMATLDIADHDGTVRAVIHDGKALFFARQVGATELREGKVVRFDRAE